MVKEADTIPPSPNAWAIGDIPCTKTVYNRANRQLIADRLNELGIEKCELTRHDVDAAYISIKYEKGVLFFSATDDSPAQSVHASYVAHAIHTMAINTPLASEVLQRLENMDQQGAQVLVGASEDNASLLEKLHTQNISSFVLQSLAHEVFEPHGLDVVSARLVDMALEDIKDKGFQISGNTPPRQEEALDPLSRRQLLLGGAAAMAVPALPRVSHAVISDDSTAATVGGLSSCGSALLAGHQLINGIKNKTAYDTFKHEYKIAQGLGEYIADYIDARAAQLGIDEFDIPCNHVADGATFDGRIATANTAQQK